MKNLPKNDRLKRRSARSPYAKYAKRPWVYSQAYRDWFRAMRKQNGKPLS